MLRTIIWVLIYLTNFLKKLDMHHPNNKAENIRQTLLQMLNFTTGVHTAEITVIDSTSVSRVTFELVFNNEILKIALENINGRLSIEFIETNIIQLSSLNSILNHFYHNYNAYYGNAILKNLN